MICQLVPASGHAPRVKLGEGESKSLPLIQSVTCFLPSLDSLQSYPSFSRREGSCRDSRISPPNPPKKVSAVITQKNGAPGFANALASINQPATKNSGMSTKFANQDAEGYFPLPDPFGGGGLFPRSCREPPEPRLTAIPKSRGRESSLASM